MNSERNVNKSKNLEFEGIIFQVSRRRVKYARIEYSPSGLMLIVPGNMSPLDVLEQNKKSILKKYAKLNEKIHAARELPVLERSEKDFASLIQHHVAGYARELKVKYTAVKIRRMKRRWGSCRSSGIITLNSYLGFLPDRLVAYIIYHELLHLKIRKHDRKFKALIAAKFSDFRLLDKELNLYGLRLLY